MMINRALVAGVFALSMVTAGTAAAEKTRGAVDCSELNWSPQVLERNPDIARACQGVFEKDGVLYAKATIRVVRVVGDTLRFRTMLNDGTFGERRGVTLDPQWRVNLDGREYRLSQLTEGQLLNIYLPEDRFSLTVQGSNNASPNPIEQVED